MSPMSGYEQERRAQRFAFIALALSALLGLIQTGVTPGSLFGMPLPAGVGLGLVILGAILGIVAVMKRAPGLAYATPGAMLTGLALTVTGEPTLVALILGLAFAGALLAFLELVHIARRYEKAHKVVETEHAPEESLNHVTIETLRTLTTRLGLAIAGVALGAGLATLLSKLGPRQWRGALETAGPIGIAVFTLALFGLASLYVLSRGGRLREQTVTLTPKSEVEIDVAE